QVHDRSHRIEEPDGGGHGPHGGAFRGFRRSRLNRIDPPPPFLSEVRDQLGSSAVLTDPAITRSHATDWTGRFRADPPVALWPTRSDDVSAVSDAARRFEVALVPQGGNTGLGGGATPLDGEVVVDLRAMAAVSDIDAES